MFAALRTADFLTAALILSEMIVIFQVKILKENALKNLKFQN